VKSLKELVHFYNTRDVFAYPVQSGHCPPGTIEVGLVIVRTLTVRSNRGSTITQSHSHSRKGAAGFSGASLVVLDSTLSRVSLRYN